MERTLEARLVKEHPEDKMLFLAGPRQVGKSTLAEHVFGRHADGGVYFNWDISSNRRRILSGEDLLAEVRAPDRRPMVVFDELHKMRRFKSWLKGFYDQRRKEVSIWVMGSARLDLYQKGGDSLVGRYFLYRMHPISVGELAPVQLSRNTLDPEQVWSRFQRSSPRASGRDPLALLHFGGFPEPFLKQEKTFHSRWIHSRRERITHEELRDLTRIDDLDRVEFLVEMLNPRIGSPLSINSLREDLDVAFETVRGWLAALERVYYVYSLRPYESRIQRSLKREQKFYFWDWSEVSEEPARFENFVVSHLRKACDTWTDFGAGEFKLWYLRDKEKREVDALITRDRKPWLIAEAKLNDLTVSPTLERFSQALGCTKILQIVQTPGVHHRVKIHSQICHVVSAMDFFPYLP